MAKDYYNILGVAKNASEEEIKKAYRKLAHQHHPDKTGGNESKFKEVNEAYQVLGNKEKRAQYDQFGQVFEGGQPGGPGGSPFGGQGFRWEDFAGFGGQGGVNFNGGDFGDIFETIFDQFGGGRPRQTYRRGSDIEAREELSLEDAFTGVKRSLRFKTHIQCETCKGLGYDKAKGEKTCTTCQGQGQVREERRTFFGNFSQVKACPACSGRGQIPNAPCKACSGAGRVSGTREVEVVIAPGVEDGQVVKIIGKGEAGEHGSETGDLYIVVHVKPHKVFARTKNELFMEHEIRFSDALLERPITLTDIGGDRFTVKVPPGFNFKEKLKVPDRGMPRFGSLSGKLGRGDLYISFILKSPKHLSGKAKKLLEELEGEV